MKIRLAKKSDFEEIANIHIESWQDSYSDVFPPDFLNNQIVPSLRQHWKDIETEEDDIILVAEEREIVGFIAVWCRPVPFIDNLHVKPACRSRKIGSALMKKAAAILLDNDKKTGYLWVFNDNKKAIRLYEKLGGKCGEIATKDFFGHKVPCCKIEWECLDSIVENA